MKNESPTPTESIVYRILNLRGEKVILDVHLAQLYQVETRALKQAVKRNLDRFPEDFMFSLSAKEMDLVVSQNVIPSRSNFGGATPFAFTEAGVAMLSSVLKGKHAIQMNILIIKTFIALRKFANNYHGILEKLHSIENKMSIHDEEIAALFRSINEILNKPKSRKARIGFKQKS